ncbi:MAG: lycopene cyclase domain-containing protein [Propioniciclava sp.]|uniref:lycopene cyclase domain-containing protein n=1 Tax=Propioniciclava sp. TaxID=2038686 RepID=UPI0039E5A0B4
MTFAWDQWQYLILMAGCLAITLPLEWLLDARVYRRPLRAFQAVLVTVIVFSVWDVIAIGFDLWTYSPRFTTGIMLPFDYPVEELVFFVVIPLCSLLTYEAVGTVLAWLSKRRPSRRKEGDDA